jgi:hypothetical protein
MGERRGAGRQLEQWIARATGARALALARSSRGRTRLRRGRAPASERRAAVRARLDTLPRTCRQLTGLDRRVAPHGGKYAMVRAERVENVGDLRFPLEVVS